MIFGGIDVSGNPDSGNYKFTSIVIGTEEKISSLTKILGNKPIHMNRLNSKTQDEVISKLSFDNKECIALCLKTERNSIVNEIHRLKKIKSGSNIRKRRVNTSYDYALWSLIQDRIKEFLQKHNYDLHDVVFQCDHDSDAFLKTIGLRHAYEGRVYVLADIVAGANNKGREPHGVIALDLADRIKQQLLNKIR